MQMVLEGGDSEKSNVKSGVPQGTVLGPLCFLLYINDMGNNISSNLKLFPDDTLLYGLVHNASDVLHHQRDLDSLVTWAQEWQMNLHPLNGIFFTFTGSSSNPIIHHYTMLGQTVKAVDHQPYLGITNSETLNWKTHILDVKNKANKTLGCIKRNLHLCPERVKAQAYTGLLSETYPRIWKYCMGSLQDVSRLLARTSTATCCAFCY